MSEMQGEVHQLEDKLRETEENLQFIKEESAKRASESLAEFETTFDHDLQQRKIRLDDQLDKWNTIFETSIKQAEENASIGLKALRDRTDDSIKTSESALTKTMREQIDEIQLKLQMEFENLEEKTDAFEEKIRAGVEQSENELENFKNELKTTAKEEREEAASSLKTEFGRFSLDTEEKLKAKEREMEVLLKGIETGITEKGAKIDALLKDIEAGINENRAKAKKTFEDARNENEDWKKHRAEFEKEAESKIAEVRASLEKIDNDLIAHRAMVFADLTERSQTLEQTILGVENRVKESVANLTEQSKLFAEADNMKDILDDKIEDLNTDLGRLEQRRNEVLGIEAELIKIKRLEEDITARAARIGNEQRRLDLLESNVNRVLQTSNEVEQKLREMSNKNDDLVQLEFKMQNLADAAARADAEFQRIEKKGELAKFTSEKVDTNFHILEESEKITDRLKGSVTEMQAKLETLSSEIKLINAEHEKAKNTVDRLGVLDSTLEDIEARIKEMQKAQQWLAGIETRMDATYKKAKEQVDIAGKLVDNVHTGNSTGLPEGPAGADRNHSISPADRDKVKALKAQGWKNEKIASSLGLSLGEVQLILDTASF
jgi:chromosome segregation ATPase